ncbi:MAG TPA: hypothetical protein VHY35_10565 [Stellaceae bacterium]|jgi:hypothetical protein|nr:hypothetical protein [Stellaceae bacterium]
MTDDATPDIIRRAQEAFRAIGKASTWANWQVIGAPIYTEQQRLLQSLGLTSAKGAGRRYSKPFGLWLKDHGFDDARVLDAAARSRLLDLMHDLPEVEAWRATLDPKRLVKLNHPSAVWRSYRKAHNPPVAKVVVPDDPAPAVANDDDDLPPGAQYVVWILDEGQPAPVHINRDPLAESTKITTSDGKRGVMTLETVESLLLRRAPVSDPPSVPLNRRH